MLNTDVEYYVLCSFWTSNTAYVASFTIILVLPELLILSNFIQFPHTYAILPGQRRYVGAGEKRAIACRFVVSNHPATARSPPQRCRRPL